MDAPIYVVDAFTHKAFHGNTAAVCFLNEYLEDQWLQSVAAEMRHAETAFLVPVADDEYHLRWFTPTIEVDLCGHATLAAAHILFSGHAQVENLRFHTRSGVLSAKREGGSIRLDFPSEPPEAAPLPFQQTWLPHEPLWTGRNRMDWFVRLASGEDVIDLQPDHRQIAALGQRGLVVTGLGSGSDDIVSRCFYPQSGVDEDSVTGSAHCALAPYWHTILGRTRLNAFQASTRGGRLVTELVEDRVHLIGQAVTVLEGRLTSATIAV